MKKCNFAFSVLLVTLWAGKGVPQAKGLVLSADFSSAATELVRTVDAYQGVTEVGIPEISDALSATSKQAHSQGEEQAMRALRIFLEDKLDNNALRAETIAKAENAWKLKHGGMAPGTDEDAILRQNALELPGVREMTHREDDCAAQLRQIFSSQSYRAPTRCSNVRLRVDAHAMQQFFPQVSGK
jgi:hypothetical protein